MENPQLKKLAHYEAKMKYYHDLIGGAKLELIKLEKTNNTKLPTEIDNIFTPELLAVIANHFTDKTNAKNSYSTLTTPIIDITFIPKSMMLGSKNHYSFEYGGIKYTITIDDSKEQFEAKQQIEADKFAAKQKKDQDKLTARQPQSQNTGIISKVKPTLQNKPGNI
jgi:hypothetical protein